MNEKQPHQAMPGPHQALHMSEKRYAMLSVMVFKLISMSPLFSILSDCNVKIHKSCFCSMKTELKDDDVLTTKKETITTSNPKRQRLGSLPHKRLR